MSHTIIKPIKIQGGSILTTGTILNTNSISIGTNIFNLPNSQTTTLSAGTKLTSPLSITTTTTQSSMVLSSGTVIGIGSSLIHSNNDFCPNSCNKGVIIINNVEGGGGGSGDYVTQEQLSAALNTKLNTDGTNAASIMTINNLITNNESSISTYSMSSTNILNSNITCTNLTISTVNNLITVDNGDIDLAIHSGGNVNIYPANGHNLINNSPPLVSDNSNSVPTTSWVNSQNYLSSTQEQTITVPWNFSAGIEIGTGNLITTTNGIISIPGNCEADYLYVGGIPTSYLSRPGMRCLGAFDISQTPGPSTTNFVGYTPVPRCGCTFQYSSSSFTAVNYWGFANKPLLLRNGAGVYSMNIINAIGPTSSNSCAYPSNSFSFIEGTNTYWSFPVTVSCDSSITTSSNYFVTFQYNVIGTIPNSSVSLFINTIGLSGGNPNLVDIANGSNLYINFSW